MSKESNNQPNLTEETEVQQAVEFTEKSANHTEPMSEEVEIARKDAKREVAVVKGEKSPKSGRGLALLALLVAVAVGAAGHYMTNRKFAEVEQQFAQKLNAVAQQNGGSIELPTFEQEKAQLNALKAETQQAQDRLNAVEEKYQQAAAELSRLQAQLDKVGAVPKVEPTLWLLSDAGFLLNNALRKMVLENDIETAKSLIVEAESILAEMQNKEISPILEALKDDLAKLNSLNDIDQNSLMQRLAQLANLVDDMPLLESETMDSSRQNDGVSDSVADWQSNLEKSANSFLNHFIRISDKKNALDRGFIAPNQEIYLRENIRLRLQIAILAVPRQQNELYKQSLDAVSTWVRSYFDVENANVAKFLKEMDDLMEQSIYVDAPNRLQSLELLEQHLNKPAKKLEKIQIESDKSLEQLKVEAPAEAEQSAEKPANAQ